jgi:ABC-type Fe3+-hydroxamate transport system substrate-binding protein
LITSLYNRIISLHPDLTTFLVTIGIGDRLVGVSDFCTIAADHPAIRLGGTGNPDQSMLAKLEPDLVIINTSPGGPFAAPALDASVPIYSFRIRTVGDAIEALQDLAATLNLREQAAPLIAGARNAQAEAYERQYTRRMRRVVAFTWRDPWVAVGGDTYADDLLRLCGGENVALRMPGRSPRAALELYMRNNPEVILLAHGPYPFEVADARAFWRFGDVSAVFRDRIRLCEANLLTHFGTRIPEAIDIVSRLIHDD